MKEKSLQESQWILATFDKILPPPCLIYYTCTTNLCHALVRRGVQQIKLETVKECGLFSKTWSKNQNSVICTPGFTFECLSLILHPNSIYWLVYDNKTTYKQAPISTHVKWLNPCMHAKGGKQHPFLWHTDSLWKHKKHTNHERKR